MNDPRPSPALTGKFSSLRSPEFPYPGLRAFEDYETEIFFGREHHIQEIIKRLSQHQFVPVIGPSGCGKSSLVRAGVIPMLRAGGYRDAGAEWRDVVMRPSNAPIWNLAQSLYDIVQTSSQAESCTKNKIAETRLEGISELASVLITDPKNGISRFRADADLDENANVLLVVDQFEEIFSQENAQTPGAVADFLNLILGIHENDFNRVHCIITMRTDHLGDCARYRGLSEAINETFYLTANLTEEELREAIELPAGVEPFYGEFVDGLPERILADMSAEDEDQLPLMQHVLRRMWEAAALRSSEQPKLTAELYHEFGGIKNAINVHAKAIQQQLIRDHGEGHEATIERLFKQLTVRREGTTYQDVRRPTTFRDLAAVLDITKKAEKDHLRAVINEFRAPNALFLRPQYSELPANQRISDAVSIDIVHECLIRKWPSLTNWIDEEWQSAKLLHDLNRLQANSGTASGETYLDDPQISRFDRWRVSQRPNAAWAAQYGCSRNNLTKMIDYLDLSKERAERVRREEIAQREEEAKRQEQVGRLEAENQRNEAQRKLLDAERDRKLEVERAELAAVTEREKRKTAMLFSAAILFIAAASFGVYQYIAATETHARRIFWENFSYNSQRKEDIANLAIDSQAKSRDHFLELITTAETVGQDVRDVAARVLKWAKALDEIKGTSNNTVLTR